MLRVARDAELELDDEGGTTHLELVERELRRRRRSDVVRLEIEDGASPELLALLQRAVRWSNSDVYVCRGPLDFRVLMAARDLPGFDELRDPPVSPVDVHRWPNSRTDMFGLIDDRDVLLHHPYDALRSRSSR